MRLAEAIKKTHWCRVDQLVGKNSERVYVGGLIMADAIIIVLEDVGESVKIGLED